MYILITKAKNISLILALSCCFLFVSTAYAASQSVTKVAFNDEDYLLTDVSLSRHSLLETLEIYRHNDTFLIPFIAISGALELKTDIDLAQGKISLTVGDQLQWINLSTGQSSFNETLPNDIWASDDFDIYLSSALLSRLLNSSVKLNLASLTLNIKSNDSNFYFPNEKRFNRNSIEKKSRQGNAEQLPVFNGEQVILDQYHLLTPPVGHVTLSASNTYDASMRYAGTLQLNSDLAYHSAFLTLNKSNNGGVLGSYLNFSRRKDSPYSTLPLGISVYGFGDISSQTNSFKSTTDTGVGAYFFSRDELITRNFGATTIDGNGVPGWEAELYYDGFYVGKQIVNERGRYLFENIETHYGINNFKVKLYGPHGEEDEHVKTLTINSNRLKAGDISYDGGFLQSESVLLQGALENKFDPNSFHFNFDVGLNDQFQLSSSWAQRNLGSDNQKSQFVGLQLQSSFNNLLLNTEYMQQLSGGSAARISGQGRISAKQQYSFDYYHQKNLSTTQPDAQNRRSSLAGGITGRFDAGIPFGYSAYADFNFLSDNKKPGTRFSLSWNLAKISYSTGLSVTPAGEKYKTLGNFNVSGGLGDWRMSSAINYDAVDDFNISAVNLSLSRQFKNRLNFNNQLNYWPGKDSHERWSFKSTASVPFDLFSLSAAASTNANKEWEVSLAVSFSVGYDHHNNRLNISRNAAYGGGTLEINSFLDRNSNNILDENDIPLAGTEFGPIGAWRNQKTGADGRVVLQGLPAALPMRFYGHWNDGVTPSVNGYNLYTHTGGYIKLDVPFTIKTDVAGYINAQRKGEIVPVANVNIELLDSNDEVISTTLTNFEGFFEFNGLAPNNYSFRVAQQSLSVRHLVSNPARYTLSTPKRGGYIEMKEFMLLPEGKQTVIASEEVELTEDNYDPAFFESEYDGKIFVSPAVNKAVKKTTFFNASKLRIATVGVGGSSLVNAQPLVSNNASSDQITTVKTNALTKATPLVERQPSVAATVQPLPAPSIKQAKFTIQLAAMKNKALIAALIQGLNKDRVFIATKASSQLSLVLYGQYDSKSAANDAVSNLPSQFINAVWVRGIDGLNTQQAYADFVK